jgi:hypothetical protein
MTRTTVVVFALLVGACGSPRRDEPGTCLDLPGARRQNLVADPAGEGMYWLEDSTSRNIDGDIHRWSQVVHYDLRSHHREVVRANIGAPLVVLRGKLLALRLTTNPTVAIVARDGTTQDLTPANLKVVDFEPVDEHTIAFIADGDGPRAVYTLDIDLPRPRYVVDADTLLDAADGHVFVLDGEQGIAIDLRSGERTTFKPTGHLFPVGIYQVEAEGSMVRGHSMIDGKVRTLVDTPDDWRFVYTPGAVLARTPPQHDVSEAVLLTATGTIPLPSVAGGTTLLGVANLDSDRWALVGHNTTNYVGDLADNSSESDVCLLPTSGTAVFKTRVVPKQYEDKRQRVFAVSEELSPGSGIQVFDGDDTPITLAIRVKPRAESDFDLMRASARKLHHGVTSLLGDREIKTEVTFSDERTAITQWRCSDQRERTFIGMGDALMSDPAELALELRSGLDDVEKGKLHCSGKLINHQAAPLTGLSVQCIAGDRTRPIPVPDLAPGASFAFAKDFEVDDEPLPNVEILRGGQTVDFLDAAHEETMHRVFDVATTVYAETGLALQEHQVDPDLVVTVHIGTDFAKATEERRLDLAHKAYDRFAALRDIYGKPEDTTLELKIQIQGLPISYEYDGEKLKKVD